MANIAQLVRALDCGSGGRGFEPHYSPQENSFRHLCLKLFSLAIASRTCALGRG